MDIEAVRAVRDRSLREGSIVSGADGSVHPLAPVAIGAAEGEALARWVREERASRTIEIGLGYGVSTLHLCEALLEDGLAATVAWYRENAGWVGRARSGEHRAFQAKHYGASAFRRAAALPAPDRETTPVRRRRRWAPGSARTTC